MEPPGHACVSAGRYLALEPLSERRAALEALRRSSPNFDFEMCAAGERDGETATITVAADLDGSRIGGGTGESRPVAIRTLDSLVAERGLPGPLLLKFDTHGFERQILAGARATLAATSVIVMEVYNFDITPHCLRFPAMCAHLETLGFRCLDLVDPMLRSRDQALWQMDLVFGRDDDPRFAQTGFE